MQKFSTWSCLDPKDSFDLWREVTRDIYDLAAPPLTARTAIIGETASIRETRDF